MNHELLYNILISTHYSEKTTYATQNSREYVFEVMSKAKKTEIKHAIENLFSTKVSAVRIVNVKFKQKRFRGVNGFRKPWKKAYVTLTEGNKIEIGNKQ